MTDAEINERVAIEVMGWHTEILQDTYLNGGEPFDQWVDANGIGQYVAREWSPAINIGAAMQVVEKMKERKFLVGIGNSAEGWEVVFIPNQSTQLHRADNESLSRAICLAALAAMETAREGSG